MKRVLTVLFSTAALLGGGSGSRQHRKNRQNSLQFHHAHGLYEALSDVRTTDRPEKIERG
jgi:hypothetical protein